SPADDDAGLAGHPRGASGTAGEDDDEASADPHRVGNRVRGRRPAVEMRVEDTADRTEPCNRRSEREKNEEAAEEPSHHRAAPNLRSFASARCEAGGFSSSCA